MAWVLKYSTSKCSTWITANVRVLHVFNLHSVQVERLHTKNIFNFTPQLKYQTYNYECNPIDVSYLGITFLSCCKRTSIV